MKDELNIMVCKEEFYEALNYDVGRIIITNQDSPDECLVYYVEHEEDEETEK